MSAEDVDLVKRWFKALEAGDLSPELCDPEIVVRNRDSSPVRLDSRCERGQDRVGHGLRDAGPGEKGGGNAPSRIDR